MPSQQGHCLCRRGFTLICAPLLFVLKISRHDKGKRQNRCYRKKAREWVYAKVFAVVSESRKSSKSSTQASGRFPALLSTGFLSTWRRREINKEKETGFVAYPMFCPRDSSAVLTTNALFPDLEPPERTEGLNWEAIT